MLVEHSSEEVISILGVFSSCCQTMKHRLQVSHRRKIFDQLFNNCARSPMTRTIRKNTPHSSVSTPRMWEGVSHSSAIAHLYLQDTVVLNKTHQSSKSRVGFVFKLLLLLGIAFTIYQNWLWLSVGTEYVFEGRRKRLISSDQLTDARM